jgi:hypothetical protein
MAYYRVCPKCGSFLDPGERCDCEEEGEQWQRVFEQMTVEKESGQLMFNMAGFERRTNC